MLGMCELIVARGLCKKIVLARLIVGHTHDSRFAIIWRRIRSVHALTMGDYKVMIESCLTSPTCPTTVEDVFCVPDYGAYISPCIDKAFGRYCKTEFTQHEFTFERVPIVDQNDPNDPLRRWFPLGVKTMWRPYISENVVRIVKDPLAPCGFTDDHLGPIVSYPQGDGDCPDGAYLLQSFPTADIKPAPFVLGSRDRLLKCCKKNQTELYEQFTQYSYSVGDVPIRRPR